MSLTEAKMQNSLKDQLLQDERDAKAELEAIAKAKPRASKAKKPKKAD
jgi:hypothetical protein